MSTDLRLIVHPTEGDAHVLTTEALSDATTKGGLPHPGRAVEAEDGRLHISLELEDSQMLEDTLLDSVETVMLAVKRLLRPLEVEVILTVDTPGKLYDGAQVLHLYGEVGALRIESLGLAQLLLEGLCYGFAPELLFALLAELVDLFV